MNGLRLGEEKSFVPGVIDVVIFDEAVCAARVQHLALGIHGHGHNGSAVVLQCLQNVVGRSLLQSFVGLTWVQSGLIDNVRTQKWSQLYTQQTTFLPSA